MEIGDWRNRFSIPSRYKYTTVTRDTGQSINLRPQARAHNLEADYPVNGFVFECLIDFQGKHISIPLPRLGSEKGSNAYYLLELADIPGYLGTSVWSFPRISLLVAGETIRGILITYVYLGT